MSELIEYQNQNTFVNPMINNINGMMSSELDGLPFSFNKIKIPSGGSLSFEIPTENENKPEIVTEFTGVILYHHAIRTYYRDKYSGSSVPPNCSSGDGNIGTGNPGGNCKTCKYAQYGSGENGGMACKTRRKIYILRKNELIPVIFELPTSSLYSLSNYISYLFKGGKPSKNVITKFELKKAQNQNGIVFSQAVFSIERSLTPEEIAVINSFAEQTEIFAKSYNNIIDEETGGANTLYYDDKAPLPSPPPSYGGSQSDAGMEVLDLNDDLLF